MSRCKECHRVYTRNLNIKNSGILLDSETIENMRITVELLAGESKEHSQVSGYTLNNNQLIITHRDDRTVYIYPMATVSRVIIQS